MLWSCVLVTGCGGDIGQGIGKVLKASGLVGRVIGCDTHTDHPGALLFDRFSLVPKTSDAGYLATLVALVRDGVDLVLPSTEPELRLLSEHDLLAGFDGIPVLAANEKALAVGLDKLSTVRLLAASGLPFPWTSIVRDGPPAKLPCVIKKRYGSGSRDFAVVDDDDLVRRFSRKRPDDIWQEYLGTDDQEYTCGLYRTAQGETRSIVIRRRLQGGFTQYGEIVHDPAIVTVLEKLAEALELEGSINAQLRLSDRGPVIFEINPRFSSTVVFRHLLGFCDVVWAITEKAGRPAEPWSGPPIGARFYRGSHEFIL